VRQQRCFVANEVFGQHLKKACNILEIASELSRTAALYASRPDGSGIAPALNKRTASSTRCCSRFAGGTIHS
jgi:hypothetical protein